MSDLEEPKLNTDKFVRNQGIIADAIQKSGEGPSKE